MENNQTAIEWLQSELTRCYTENDKRIAFRVAKLMEKEQIMSAYIVCDDSGTIEESRLWAEKYYKENYNAKKLPEE